MKNGHPTSSRKPPGSWMNISDGNARRSTFRCYSPARTFKKSVAEVIGNPYGETLSYDDMATQLGMPKSVRAVANANGANAISIIVPCHRVVGRGHTLTGYGGGLAAKSFLLELEKSSCPPLSFHSHNKY